MDYLRRVQGRALLLLIAGCAAPQPAALPPPPPARPAGATQHDAAPLPAPAITGAAPDAAPPPALEPVDAQPPADPPVVVEIFSPFAEQVVPAAKAAGYRVRLKVEGWPPATGGDVLILLDDHPARRLAGRREAALATLVADDRELLPGEHLLVAAAVRPNGEVVRTREASRAAFAAVRFFVAERGTPGRDVHAPQVVLVSPRGTLNGEAAADGARLDYLVLAAPSRPLGVEARLTGRDGSARARSSGWRPFAIRHLASGDWDAELVLLGPDGAPLAAEQSRAKVTFTVNRDAPSPDGSAR
jgi:hypothetical protein